MMVEQDVEWSNADEVIRFLNEHKGVNFEVGEYFALPDIEQVYTVVAVRPFRHKGSFYLFLDLEAECAVAECRNTFAVSMDVNRWRKSRYITRCCAEHPHKFSTSMRMPWKTIEERCELIEAGRISGERRRKLEAALAQHKRSRRIGVTQAAVRAALQDLAVLGAKPKDEDIVRLAIAKLPVPKGRRDTRKQRVVRALARLRQTEDAADLL